MLGMALRRDVARCVKVVGILVVDGWCDMTCQHMIQQKVSKCGKNRR